MWEGDASIDLRGVIFCLRMQEWIRVVFVLLCMGVMSIRSSNLHSHRNLYPELHTNAANQNPVNKRLIVLVIDGLGLANRLRSLADWYVMARLTNRTLVVSWEATIDCNALFMDLFEDWPAKLEILQHPLPSGNLAFQWLESAAEARGIRYYSFDHLNAGETFWKANNSIWARQDILFSNEIDSIFTNFLGLLTFDTMPCSVYKHLRGKFLRSLIPVENIRRSVQSIYHERFESKLVVGVHIRTHNDSYDWPMVMVPGKADAQVLGDGVTVEHFVSIMHRIYRHFGFSTSRGIPEVVNKSDSSILPEKSRVSFFVTSNSRDVKGKVLNYINGDSAFQIEIEDYSRSTIVGVQSALVEFLLLARANLVIHTYGSSFSLEAAALGELPVASVLSHAVFYRDSRVHQYCGDTLIARSQLWNDTTLPEETAYEGTYDNRAVRVKYTMVHKCDDMRNWGIYEQPNQLPVYCYKRPKE